MKNEKNYMCFRIPKVWQILKRFAGIFLSSTNPEIVRSEIFIFQKYETIYKIPCSFKGFFPICIPRHEDLQALGRSFLWSVYYMLGGHNTQLQIGV